METDNKYFERLMEQEYNPKVKNMSNQELIKEVLKILLNKEDIDDEFEKVFYEYENSEKSKRQLNTLIGLFEHHHEFKREKREIESEIRELDDEILKTENEIEELERKIRELKEQE